MEQGATHYTHWFQPLTGLTAEKHDSFYSPTGDGTAIAEFSGKELIQGEPDASSFPTGGIRATFEARGYTAWDPTSPAFILENPNGALLCIPTAFVSWTGEALDHKIPLLRSMDALSQARRCARCELFGDDDAAARLHDGRARAGVLPDRRAVLLRAPRPLHDRAARCSAPSRPRATSSTSTTSARSPSASWPACSRPSRSCSKLGVPVKTRHNEVAPDAVRARADLRELQRRLRPPAADDAGPAERRPPLRPGLPAAREAVRRRQRLGQAQQLVDGHRHRRTTCSTRATRRTRTRSSCSSARPSSRRSTSTRRCCARRSPTSARTTASAPTRRRRRSSRSSSAPSCEKAFDEDRDRQGRRGDQEGPAWASAPRCCRTLPHARRRPQPHLAVRLHRQQVRVPRAGLEHVAGLRQHGAEHDRRRVDRRADRAAREAAQGAQGRPRRRPCRRSSRTSGRPTSRSSSTATTTPRSGTRRPSSAG